MEPFYPVWITDKQQYTMYLLTGFYVVLQPCHLHVLGASIRKGRLAVPQGPEEAGSGQPKVAVRSRHSVRGFRRSIRKCCTRVQLLQDRTTVL